MTDRRVEAVVLAAHGIRLEALTLAHEDGLAEAAADGELWQLRVTSVPAPGETRAYIESALAMREAGHRLKDRSRSVTVPLCLGEPARGAEIDGFQVWPEHLGHGPGPLR